METVQQYLNALPAGRVLDVATGQGNFIHALLELCPSYEEIIGIDTNEKGAAAFETAFTGKPVHFLKMDASHMDFPDSSFDIVSIAYSLHHMPDQQVVLAEMRRVLRSGGHFIISEMYCDDQTEEQMTHVLLHHWWAAIDTAHGVHHQETFKRQQVLDILNSLELQDLRIEDTKDLSSDPLDSETVRYLLNGVDMYLERARDLPDETDLLERGQELRRRIQEVGFRSATSILAVGRK